MNMKLPSLFFHLTLTSRRIFNTIFLRICRINDQTEKPVNYLTKISQVIFQVFREKLNCKRSLKVLCSSQSQILIFLSNTPQNSLDFLHIQQPVCRKTLSFCFLLKLTCCWTFGLCVSACVCASSHFVKNRKQQRMEHSSEFINLYGRRENKLLQHGDFKPSHFFKKNL